MDMCQCFEVLGKQICRAVFFYTDMVLELCGSLKQGLQEVSRGTLRHVRRSYVCWVNEGPPYTPHPLVPSFQIISLFKLLYVSLNY
jgi:hypothetical protein